MTNEQIHSLIFGTPWKRCDLHLNDGRTIALEHPDYAFMPRSREWVLWAPDNAPLQFIPCAAIASIEIHNLIRA